VQGAGHTLARSIGGLIEFIVVVLPWAVLLTAGGFGARALGRRWKAQGTAAR